MTSPPSPPSPSSSPPLPSHVESLKERALEHYKTESWASAVMLYSEALQAASHSALLFRNRAAVLQKRNWEGDVYAALRDCFRALALEPQHPKVYQRMAKCLQKLGRFEEAKLCMDDFGRCHSEASQSPTCKRLYTEILNGVFQSSFGNGSTSSSSTNGFNGTVPPSDDYHSKILQQERHWRSEASDYIAHYAGHCNTTTDIKEAVFLGQSGDFVAAGSDDGNLFIWETATGNLVRLMPADENIVNCVQCHPSTSMVVTSGIGHTVKIWEPLGESQLSNDADMIQTTRRNQTRMNEDPLEMLFMHMGDLTHVFSSHELGRGRGRGSVGLSIFRRSGENEGEDDEDDDDEPGPQHAFEFLRIPRPDAGGGGSGGTGEGGAAAGGPGVPDVQCRTC
ncbi:WD40 repeat [Trinorchestia longiramus]|nr:WD40 repeat [Trinorchestia longiramus]